MRFNYLEVIGVALILLAGVLAMQIYYNEKDSTCSSDPLVYAAQFYENQINEDYSFVGTASYINRDGPPINSPTITFSSQGISISKLVGDGDTSILLLNNSFRN